MTARPVFTGVRVAAFVVAVVAFVFVGPASVSRLGRADALELGAFTAIAIALALFGAPDAAVERARRNRWRGAHIALLPPLLAVTFAVYGWYEAAAIDALAHLVQPARAHKRTFVGRLLDAGCRVVVWIVVAPLHLVLAHRVEGVGFVPLLVFIGANAAWCAPLAISWTGLAAALRQRVPMRSPRRPTRDELVALLALPAQLAWGYVAFLVLARDNAALGIAVLSPVVLVSALLKQLAIARSQVLRLTLSREAVEAMLGAHDPLPQMRSIIESIDPRLASESIEIFGFGRGGADAWSSVARLGPPAPELLANCAQRALDDLRAHRGSVEGVRCADGVVIAYAAFDTDKRLLGALAVYRADGTEPLVAPREFERAAAELTPLLSDFGTITATRTAASVDTLTGLVNRRAVDHAVDEALAYARTGGSYALLLLDVDHFKSINDTLGHNAGDRVLARIGRILMENVREGDLAGRFGGEEFVVLMRNADRDRSLAIAERLRAAIQNSGLAYADGRPITFSIGVTYGHVGDTTSETVIERADRALYRAKHAGRNRVVESPLAAAS